MSTKRNQANIWSRIEVRGEDECWPWTGAVAKNGYGRIKWDRLSQRVHRVIYELVIGPIPQDLVIDHECRNRICQNPKHLRAVTHRTNTMENSVGIAATNFAKDACVNGHPFSNDNVRRGEGFRRCVECSREKHRRWRERRRAA